MILVAPPGTGKTSVLEFVQCDTSFFFSDFTSREMKNAVGGNPALTHLMLGDFLSLFGHAKGTVKLSINLLSRVTGDTIRQKPWSGEEIPPRRMGFISAIPPEDLDKREIKAHVRSGGFASRFIFAKFNYSQSTIEKIHKFIREGKYRGSKQIPINIKSGSYLVEVPLKIATEIDLVARRIKNDPVGIRAHHHLRTLACSIARMNKRNTVTEKDFEKVMEFTDFFSERGKTL
jgi:hypothetical protein